MQLLLQQTHTNTHARSVKRHTSTKHGSWTRALRGTPTCRLPQTQTEATPWPAHDGESRLWRHMTRRADRHAGRDKLLTSLLDPAFLNDGDIAHVASVTLYSPLLHTSSWRSEEGGKEERRGEGGQLSQPQRLSPSLTAALCLSLSVVLAGCLSLSLRSQRRCVAVFPSFRCFSLSRFLRDAVSLSLQIFPLLDSDSAWKKHKKGACRFFTLLFVFTPPFVLTQSDRQSL